MKLNDKRTILVGLAFLSICAFWQMYDNIVPLILTRTFHMNETISGLIMAADNILALFLLPFFGSLSDRTNTKIGKRMPFILFGTGCAIILMNLLPLIENSYYAAPSTAKTVSFVIVLGLLLIAMGTYRSPAVALMPDVTPKPLRSKANAIINLMGALGGVFTLGVTGLLVHAGATGRNDYTMLFLAVSLLMAISVIVLVLTVRENKLAAEVAAMETDEEKEAEAEEKKESGKAFGELAPDMRRSLWLILFSVAFWFMGYNAVTSAFTRYMQVQWGYDIKAASLCLMVATVGAVLSYLPVGILSSKFGRKKLIQAGVILLAVCFATAGLFTAFHPAVYVVFALVGVAWAMINVNSYPMVVEISKSGDVGKYTGYYYTFSMAAQIITPILSGLLLEHVGYQTLMPYATVMVAISFVTISLARHGDNKPEPPKSKLEAFDVGDD